MNIKNIIIIISSILTTAVASAAAIDEIKSHEDKKCYVFGEPRTFWGSFAKGFGGYAVGGMAGLHSANADKGNIKNTHQVCDLNLLEAMEFAAKIHFGSNLEFYLWPKNDKSYRIEVFPAADMDDCRLSSVTAVGVKNSKEHDLHTRIELCKVNNDVLVKNNSVSHQRYMELTSEEDE